MVLVMESVVVLITLAGDGCEAGVAGGSSDLVLFHNQWWWSMTMKVVVMRRIYVM